MAEGPGCQGGRGDGVPGYCPGDVGDDCRRCRRNRSAINDANASAAGPTTGLVAAAEDEVSAAIAKLFGGYGQQYQALARQSGGVPRRVHPGAGRRGKRLREAEASDVAASERATRRANRWHDTLTGRGLGAASRRVDHGRHREPATRPGLPGERQHLVHPTASSPGPIPLHQFTPEQFWPVTPQLGGARRSASPSLRASACWTAGSSHK